MESALLGAEIAIEAYAQRDELLGNVALLSAGVAGDINADMGAAGTKDAYAALNVGVAVEVLARDYGVVLRGDVGVEVFVTSVDVDVDIVGREEGVAIVLEIVFDDGEEPLLSEPLVA